MRWRFIHGGDGDGDRDGSWGGGVRLGAALKAAANASSVATLVACLWQRLAQPRAAAEARVAMVVWFGLVWFLWVSKEQKPTDKNDLSSGRK